jgi:hypothetical protein
MMMNMKREEFNARLLHQMGTFIPQQRDPATTINRARDFRPRLPALRGTVSAAMGEQHCADKKCGR